MQTKVFHQLRQGNRLFCEVGSGVPLLTVENERLRFQNNKRYINNPKVTLYT